MFGMLYYFFIGLFKIFYELYTSTVSSIRRIRGLNGDGTGFGYVDYHGVFRDRVTNKHAFMNNTTGRFEDYKGNILYDPNIERIEKYREENRKEAIEKGRSTYIWLKSRDREYDIRHSDIYGDRYKDIKSEKILLTRRILEDNFYIDIETGEIVRMTDSWKIFREKNPIKYGDLCMLDSEEEYLNDIKKCKDRYFDMIDCGDSYERKVI